MITDDGYLTEAVWYWRHSCSGAIWDQFIVHCLVFPWTTNCTVLYFYSVTDFIILISIYKTMLIFCSSNWRPIHANSFPPLYSPRFHTHIGSLWSATAWWGIWIINEKPSHLVVTVDPVSTLMLMSLQRELAGTNMCWPVFVPQITAKMVTLIMMKIHSCYVMPFLS